MAAPRTAAIVLNWNGIASTRVAVASLAASPAAPAIVVVDNGSSGDEAGRMRAEFANVNVIALERNEGFSGGVNAGAIAALRSGARYLLLLNNDAWISREGDVVSREGDVDSSEGDVISRLESLLESDETIGAAGPIICNPDGSVQSSGYDYSLWFPLPRARRPSSPKRVARGMFLSGSCLLVRGSLFARIGGLDPDLFMYGDDVDLAMRMQNAGFDRALLDDRTVYHARGSTIGLASTRYIYSVLRGNLIVVLKHAAPYQYPTAFLTLFVASVGLVALAIRRHGFAAPRAALKAWVDFATKRWGGFDGVRVTSAQRPSMLDYVATARAGDRASVPA